MVYKTCFSSCAAAVRKIMSIGPNSVPNNPEFNDSCGNWPLETLWEKEKMRGIMRR